MPGPAADAVKLVAGLGNPGARYEETRHNVGFDVIDRLAERHGLAFATSPVDALETRWRHPAGPVLLVKPLTYMNRSGEAVGGLVRYYRVELADLLVVCDDVHLPIGRIRARSGGSEGGHNGLRSIAEALATTEYARLRIGVGRGDDRRDLSDHVLGRFSPEEEAGIREAVTRSADAVEAWIAHGLSAMMNTFNRAVDDR